MNKHVQIREIPEEMHRKLKMRAAAEGLSMSEYLKRLIERDLRRPNCDAIKARMAEMEPIILDPSPTELIREERDRR